MKSNDKRLTSLEDFSQAIIDGIVHEAIQETNGNLKGIAERIFLITESRTGVTHRKDDSRTGIKCSFPLIDGTLFIKVIAPTPEFQINSTYIRLNFWESVEELELDIACQLGKARGYMILITGTGELSSDTSHSKAYGMSDGFYGTEDIKEYHGASRHSRVSLQLGPYELKWHRNEYKRDYLALEVSEDENKAANEKSEGEAKTGIEDIIPALLNESRIHSSGFYRGQANLRFLMLPSGLRGTDESRLFHEVITRHPQDYIGISNLERLTKIQHAGAPTRLLDVTSNPLVALFFSISSLNSSKYDELHINDEQKCALKSAREWKLDKEKTTKNVNTPTLMFIPADSQEIRSFDSDTCRCLAALACLDGKDQQQLRSAAVMDLFIQIYTDILFRTYVSNKAPHIEECIIKDTIRFYLHGVLRHTEIKEKGTIRLTKSKANIRVSDEVRRKIHVKFHRYDHINDVNTLDIVDDILSDVDIKAAGIKFTRAGIAFTIKSIEDPNGSGSKEKIIVPVFNMKEAVEDFMSEDREVSFLINPETGEYDCDVLLRLHGHITQEAPAFAIKLKPSDILNGVFVRPMFNSDRMIAQHGAFMLYGLSFFWNIWKAIRYFYRELSMKDSELWTTISRRLIFNDQRFLLPDNVVIKKKDKYTTCPPDPKKLHDFMYAIYRIKSWELDGTEDMKDRLLRQLGLLGVDKVTMGRSVETTWFGLNRSESTTFTLRQQ